MANVVLDASVMLAVVLREPHADAVSGLFDGWARDGATLNAPTLAHYEVASTLTRARSRGNLAAQDTTNRTLE